MAPLREVLEAVPPSVFVDLLESADAYVLVVDLPGVTAETVDLTADGGHLVVEGRREKPVPGGYAYLSEERSTFVDARLPLPDDADVAAATADVEDGVLEVHLPRATDGGATRIAVETPGTDD